MSKKPDFDVDTSTVNNLLNNLGTLSGRFNDGDSDRPGHNRVDGTTADRHDGMPSPPEPPPGQDKPSKYTLLLSTDEALAFDELAMTLRRRLGRRVDKSTMMRALIALAGKDQAVRVLLEHEIAEAPRAQ